MDFIRRLYLNIRVNLGVLWFYFGMLTNNQRQVVLYSMGKVGSTSMAASFKKIRISSFCSFSAIEGLPLKPYQHSLEKKSV